MNKYQEAFARLEYFIFKIEKYGEFEDFDKLIENFEVVKDLKILEQFVFRNKRNAKINSYGVRFCPNCDGSLWQDKDESNYCFRCGQPIESEEE